MPIIEQNFTVNHLRDRVWATFQNLPLVVGCIPGASLVEPPQAGKIHGRMTVKLGPVKADFGGEATVETDPTDFTGTIAGTGLDKSHSSRAKGKVEYQLAETPDGAGTTVAVTVDYTLSGSLAQFARGGIVEAVADQITRDFVANLENELNAASAPAESGGQNSQEDESAGGPRSEAQPGQRRDSRELNVLSLLWSMIGTRLKRLFGKN